MKKIRIVVVIYIFIVCLLVFIPLGVLLVNSLRSTEDLLRGFIKIPKGLTIDNYIAVIVDNGGIRYLFNSVFLTLSSVGLSFIVSPYMAFLLAVRWDSKKYRVLYIILSSCMLIPENVLLFPLIKVLYSLHMMNYIGLILYYVVYFIPGNLFILVPYFKAMNKDILYAAQLDGCSENQVFRSIVLPVYKPIITTVLIINAIWTWNDFLMPLLVLSKSPELWSIPIFIYNFAGKGSFEKNIAFSACQLGLLPIVVFYSVFHKKIMDGLQRII